MAAVPSRLRSSSVTPKKPRMACSARDIGEAWGLAFRRLGMGDDLELHAVGVGEGKDLLGEAGGVDRGEAILEEALLPEVKRRQAGR